MTVFGVGEHQAGDEGAELERQARLLGGEARGEHDQERGRREHLVGGHPGDEVQHRADQEACGERDHQHHRHRFGHGHEKAGREGAAGLAERLDQDQERPDRDVLDQQDRDRDAPELGERAPEIAQHLEHHRGRRQRERAADDDRRLAAQAGEAGHDRDHGRGHQELRERQPIDPHAEQAQPLELQLQAETEQQEHDAELGQHVHRVQIPDHAEARGADRRAADQEAEHRAELEPREHRGERDEGKQHDDGLRHGRRYLDGLLLHP